MEIPTCWNMRESQPVTTTPTAGTVTARTQLSTSAPAEATLTTVGVPIAVTPGTGVCAKENAAQQRKLVAIVYDAPHSAPFQKLSMFTTPRNAPQQKGVRNFRPAPPPP